jgi:glycosyltransferase involved in cell wall biosynthesis
MIPLMRLAYPRADAVVAVSRGVADDLKRTLRLPELEIQVIPNPVISPRFEELAESEPDHPWLSDGGPPVIVSAGRLVAQKDHAMLLEAFARLRQRRAARLIVFGEGPLRKSLEMLRDRLQLTTDTIDLAGHCENVLCHFANADLVALSSRYEGSPNVLTEALATGCPVVATDCPSGPAELVSSDAVGMLVPVGDPAAMCAAMDSALARTWERKSIRQSVAVHSAANSAAAYLRVLGIAPPRGPALPVTKSAIGSMPRFVDTANSLTTVANSFPRT